MKKLISTVVVIMMCVSTTAQFKFGLQAGSSLANVQLQATQPGATTKLITTTKFGFVIGVMAEYKVAPSVTFRPELNFIQKGFKLNYMQSESGFSVTSAGHEALNFIELPLYFIYHIPLKTGSIFFGAGSI